MKQKSIVKETSHEEKRLKIREGRFMVASANISGDTACVLHLPGERLAFILSDGMGKGTKAGEESRKVVSELKKLLKKGVQPSRAIKLLNRKLINDEESFATLDLAIIDKNTSVARIYKMGAASSFLLRNNKVKKIERAALPVGVVKRIKASQIKVKLKQEDTLVMVSDGITEADRKDLEARWLEEYLGKAHGDIGPKTMANEIANIAQSKYRKREKDDITVFVVQIKK